jgi:diguanylate cyclase (GGDEF)-like protein
MKPRLLLLLLLSLLLGKVAAVAANTHVPANFPPDEPIGRYASYLKETDGRLALDQAIAAYDRGAFSAGRNHVLTFGIGSEPVWIHFRVANETTGSLPRQLSIETAWLNEVDVYFRYRGKTLAAYQVGDGKAFALRPVDSRYYKFDHVFAPGVSEVFVRVQTPDPMVVPIYLMSPQQAQFRETQEDYSYGFLYGFLFALLIYNFMLYVGLRDLRYLLYSLYLGMFLLMNISYTGHGFMWFWPTHTDWEQWSNPVLMVLYGASGLFFALRFLGTNRNFPRAHNAVLGFLGVAGFLLLLAILFGNQKIALLVAFTFVFLFTIIMLSLGAMAVRSGQKAARYFLLAALLAMIGAAVTALAVWGFLPFSIWTFRAVDIGMLLDATLLALALTYQFRIGQEEKQRAEQLSRLDPLTEVNNRRAFYDFTRAIWNIATRHDHNLCIVLLDIDNFKRINDAHGHACGDEYLIATANVLKKSIRDQDVLARWGGEEFILLLPETNLHEAAELAERLRAAIAGLRLNCGGAEITATASFGVAQREKQQRSMDALISLADDQLYRAKDLGRNRVSHN